MATEDVSTVSTPAHQDESRRHPPEVDSFVDHFLSTMCETTRRQILELLAQPTREEPGLSRATVYRDCQSLGPGAFHHVGTSQAAERHRTDNLAQRREDHLLLYSQCPLSASVSRVSSRFAHRAFLPSVSVYGEKCFLVLQSHLARRSHDEMACQAQSSKKALERQCACGAVLPFKWDWSMQDRLPHLSQALLHTTSTL